MDLTQKIGPFTLAQLCRTSHREWDNNPPEEVVIELERLVALCLGPLVSQFGPAFVTSGYRSEGVNRAVGGALRSAHIYGRAADLVFLDDRVSRDVVLAWLQASGLPFDQAIDEHSSTGGWLHIGIAAVDEFPRRQLLQKYPGKPFEVWRA